MRQYLQGLLTTIAMIVAVLIADFLARLIFNSAILTIVSVTSAVACLGTLGYLFKRWNGPLIFAPDGKSMSRLLPFLLGVGTVLGPIDLIHASFPIPGVIPLANLALLALSIPLAGISAFGPMLVGSIFWKHEPTWL